MAGALDIGLIADPLRWPRWPEARALLLPALDLSDDLIETVEARLSSGDAQLGVVADGEQLLAAMVLQTIDTRKGRMIELHLIGGHGRKKWIHKLSELLTEGAREGGCVGVRAIGRHGWARDLMKEGWRDVARVYERKAA